MNAQAMTPFGRALFDYYAGKTDAQLVVRRDDGLSAPLPASYFFRTPEQFSPLEREALTRCSGSVLDIGAGSGLHSLVLQASGLIVTSLDISREAVDIMQRRGVHNPRLGDIFTYDSGPHDTLLLLGHGIGIVEDLEGLRKFLRHAQRLLRSGGQMLLDSLDVERSDDPKNKAYHEINRQHGRYVGETRIRFEYEGSSGPECGWLHVSPAALADEATKTGWVCTTLLSEPSGEHLSRLVRTPAVS